MIIELYGLPGSGKSTFARAIEACGYAPPRHQNILMRCWYFFYFLCNHSRFTITCVWICLTEGRGLFLIQWKLRVLFNRIARWQEARRNMGNIVLDEGMLQQIIGLFERTPSAERIRKLLMLAPQADMHIMFDLPWETVLYRQKKRARGMRSFMGSQYEVQWRKVVLEVHSIIMNESREVYKNCYFIKGGEDEERILEMVCSH